MIEFEVAPHHGSGPVRLGMSREEARKAMPGEPQMFRKGPDSEYLTDAYCDSGFQIFYEGSKPRVEYIALCRDSGLIARYRGWDVFGTEAEKLIEGISQIAPYDQTDPELGYSYTFPGLEMSLWRPVMPQSANDPEGRFFSTIGVGTKGYYSKGF
jgi:hypothetical protein